MNRQSLNWAVAIVLFGAVAALGGPVHADTLHVPADHPTIQEAIDAASDGDTIIVAPGTYEESINLAGKAVHLLSSDGRYVTMITGSKSFVSIVTCDSGEGFDTIIEGFSITGGQAFRGAGMYIEKASPSIVDCHFTQNTAWDDGGALYCEFGSPTITGSTFTNNLAKSFGGALAVEGADCVVTQCSFDSNTAAEGGAIAVTSGGTLECTGCTFTDNFAWNVGGAVHSDLASVATVTECSFDDNECLAGPNNEGGGAIQALWMAEIVDCDFTGNTAMFLAGALQVSLGATVTGCHFEGNSAVLGGAVRADGEVSIHECTFVGNMGNQGGAISTGPGVSIEDSWFSENGATLGGAIEANNGQGTVIDNCTFEGNAAPRGGAVAATFADDLLIRNSTFTGGNSAKVGGAVFQLDASQNLTLEQVSFANNVASLEGGAVACSGDTVTIDQCVFEQNESGASGGGVATSDECSVAISGSQFLHNVAADGGGGVANLGGDGSIVDTLFCGNTPDHFLGLWFDSGGNVFAPPADFDCSGTVDGADLAILLGAWGACPPAEPGSNGGECGRCPADLNDNCTVDGADLAILLGNWG